MVYLISATRFSDEVCYEVFTKDRISILILRPEIPCFNSKVK